ncbi:MAG: DUF2238 domain-containing protein [Akkermansiaceae bacterium]|nr:DUF2238 domain-containing protein [Akkermansiaceae bacterium]
MNEPSPAAAPRLMALGLFTSAYLAISAIVSSLRGNGEFVFYIVVMLILIGAILHVHRRVALTGGILWGLTIWGLLHMAGGLVPLPEGVPFNGDQRVLYSWWLIPNRLKYDQVVHAYGFGITTWMCWHILRTTLRDPSGVHPRPTFGLLVLCGAAGMGFGALNEVIEFFATLSLPNTNVGGYENTGWDLVSNLVGCVIAGVVIRAAARCARD